MAFSLLARRAVRMQRAGTPALGAHRSLSTFRKRNRRLSSTSAAAPSDAENPWRVSTDVVSRQTVRSVWATLDQAASPREGDPLPPGFHWAAFHDAVTLSELGSDGLPFDRGLGVDPETLPEVWKRRLVGGRLEWNRPIPIGSPVEKRSYVSETQTMDSVGEGTTDPHPHLVCVTLRHEYLPAGDAAAEPYLVEHLEYVYSETPPVFEQLHELFPSSPSATLMDINTQYFDADMLPKAGVSPAHEVPQEHLVQPPSPNVVLPAGDALPDSESVDEIVPSDSAPNAWNKAILPDPLQLFRFSALTFNAHRIHFDFNYATEIEGYPGLVVQNRLLALQLLNLVGENMPNRAIRAFEFRCSAPVVVTPGNVDELKTLCILLHGSPPRPGRNDAALWITQNGEIAVRAKVELVP